MTFELKKTWTESTKPIFGTCGGAGTPDETVRQMSLIGSKIARKDINWSDGETTKGSFHVPTSYEAHVQALRSAGMRSLHLIMSGNTLYGSQSYKYPPITDEQIAAAGRWAAFVAKHFGAGDDYELYNEPDLAGSWPSGPDPVQYSKVANALGKAIFDATGIKSITGGVAYTVGFLGKCSFNYAYFKGVGFHPYTGDDEFVSNGKLSVLPEDYWKRAAALKVEAKAPTNVPMVPTESGVWFYKGVAGNFPRAKIHTFRRLLSRLYGDAPFDLSYRLTDTANASKDEASFGMFGLDGKLKPQGEAFAAVALPLNRAKQVNCYIGKTGTVDAGLYKVEMVEADRTTTFLWNAGPLNSVIQGVDENALPQITQTVTESPVLQSLIADIKSAQVDLDAIQKVQTLQSTAISDLKTKIAGAMSKIS